MAEISFQQTQRTSQIQSQKMSQRQIYSLSLLSMNSQELRSEVFSAVDKNPALEIDKDPLNGVSSVSKISKNFSDNLHYGSSFARGQEKADAFQEILESRPDNRETLQQHLLSQLNSSRVSESQYSLCRRLIENLDSSGFHILSPYSMLDKSDSNQTAALLEFCLDFVQNLDPLGTCCTNIEESLFVQAKARPDAPPAALFLLDGHFDFLSPPRPALVLKKIQDFAAGQKKKVFAASSSELEKSGFLSENFTVQDIENALSFIKTLEPRPARQFASAASPFVVPDVYVTKIPDSGAGTFQEKDVVSGNGRSSFKISVADNVIPSVCLASDYLQFEKSASDRKGAHSVSSEEKKFIESSVKNARIFIENLEFRSQTIVRACSAIVRFQLAFFEKGPKYLVPLRQKDVADAIEVHEATVSRMANSKYIQCEWGLFPIKFFFSNAVQQKDSIQQISSAPESISRQSVKFEISSIIKSQPPQAKRLSDQKIVELLEAKGIKIARRTVAKYRAQLNIESSYSR